MTQRKRASALATTLGLLGTVLATLPAACGEAHDGSSGGSSGGGSAGSGRADPVAQGERVYKLACGQCHMIGLMGAKNLPTSLAESRARVADFEAHVAALEASAPELYAANQAALDAVLAVPQGPERYAVWLGQYLANPRFDRTLSRMNAVQLSRGDFTALLAYLEAQP